MIARPPATSAPIVTRFAPSPSGYLHLGHAHSALTGWCAARAGGGRFLLRIEDIDLGRCRPEFETAIIEDLGWLGLDWEAPPRRQSEHMADYQGALERLDAAGLLYPCFCTRQEIQAEIAGAARAPHGPEEPLYPGTCRGLGADERQALIAEGRSYALRLNVEEAAARAGPLAWSDLRRGQIAADPRSLGDVVLARKDVATSYHLAVTLDDALQGVTRVTRGQDLFHATHVHRLLQALLELPVPEWQHHDLIADAAGERLAKRSDAFSIRALREAGKSPAEVRALAGFAG
jgi:glutamyl-Q tRNA(Asp) synthetase